MSPVSRAYVTFLAGNGDYVKGVVGLAKGLRKAKSAYPLVVAVLPDVPEEHRQILESQGCIVREIEPVNPLRMGPNMPWHIMLSITQSFVYGRGTNVNTNNGHQGFTHLFDTTFESTEGVAEYVAHPDHVEFANSFIPNLDKFVVFDYKPATVRI